MNAQAYIEKFARALQSNDLKTAEDALHTWDLTDANDPELYVAYFNFYTVKALEKDSTKFDKQYAHKAIEYIGEGVDRFPTRLDMRIVKMYMYANIKEFKPLTEEVIKMIDYSKKIQHQWKDEGFSIVTRPYEMVTGAVAEFQEILLNQETEACNLDVIRISEKMLTVFPRNAQSYINISSAYLPQKKYDVCLENLLKAKEIEPNKSSLLYKIGYIYEQKGDKANAKQYYEASIKHAKERDEKFKNASQKQLKGLK